MVNKKSLVFVGILACATCLLPVATSAATEVTNNAETSVAALTQSSISPADKLAMGQGPIDIKPLKVISRTKSSAILPNVTTYQYNYGLSFTLSAWASYSSPSNYYLTSGRTITYTGTWTPGALYFYAGLKDYYKGTTYGVLMGNNGNDTVTLQAPSTGSGYYNFWAYNTNDETAYINKLTASY